MVRSVYTKTVVTLREPKKEGAVSEKKIVMGSNASKPTTQKQQGKEETRLSEWRPKKEKRELNNKSRSGSSSDTKQSH